MKITLAKILEHENLVNELRKVKAREAELRRQLVGAITTETKAGTYKGLFKFGECVAKVNTYLKIDKEELEAVMHKLSDAELAAVKWRPEVKKREFQLLDKKAPLRRIVNETPGMPSFVFTPKKKGK